MYIFIMLEVNDNRLSEDQKKLVMAFNAAGDFLIARSSNSELSDDQSKFVVHGSLEELQSSTTKGQTNSAIAGEANILISQYAYDHDSDVTYVQAIKTAGYQTVDIFYCDILPSAEGKKQTQLKEDYRRKIELGLLMEASQQDALPPQYLQRELQARMLV